MKTKTIKSLKKELLIIELPEKADYKLTKEYIFVWDINNYKETPKRFKGNFTLLVKIDDIKEDDVIDLVEQSLHTNLFAHYVSGINPPNIYQYKTALESFNSAIEKEIYLVNPLGESKPNKSYFLDDNGSFLRQEKKQWEEAQEKTFDKSRTLIFIKN